MTDPTDMDPTPAPATSGRSAHRLHFAVAFLASLIAVAALGTGVIYAYEQQHAGRVLPGVRVGDYDLFAVARAVRRPGRLCGCGKDGQRDGPVTGPGCGPCCGGSPGVMRRILPFRRRGACACFCASTVVYREALGVVVRDSFGLTVLMADGRELTASELVAEHPSLRDAVSAL